MAREVTCRDLGIADCDEVFRGETAADVVAQVREHLEEHHDIDIPSADVVLQTGTFPNWKALAESILNMGYDEGTTTIVRRLREELNVGTAPR
jgi:predicted small metal-binding protein